ncbi:MAG TPA: hypothetical protein PLC47_01755, partial [Bacteroidales bacterium]|nr:hypothetical protein [Bacteroidales bacterium]
LLAYRVLAILINHAIKLKAGKNSFCFDFYFYLIGFVSALTKCIMKLTLNTNFASNQSRQRLQVLVFTIFDVPTFGNENNFCYCYLIVY